MSTGNTLQFHLGRTGNLGITLKMPFKMQSLISKTKDQSKTFHGCLTLLSWKRQNTLGRKNMFRGQLLNGSDFLTSGDGRTSQYKTHRLILFYEKLRDL